MESPFPPRCAARFQALRLLATGGYGAVYVATQRSMERPVAVKLLHEDALADDEQVQRFLEEGRITAALNHPHVVAIIDHDVEGAIPWIAFEYLPGRTLREAVRPGPLPWRDAVRVAHQVALALEAAHSRDIVHRDVKPDNVLESAADHWKLADFGIAKWSREGAVRTRTGVILGTPAYISPEQVRGEPAGPASDCYALGVMLFELVTGATPFRDASPIVVLERHLNSDPPVPSRKNRDLPPGLDAVILRALAKDPGRRFENTAGMRAALERILDRSSAPVPGVLARPRGRHPGSVRGLALSLVLLVAAMLLSHRERAGPGVAAGSPAIRRTVGTPPAMFERAPFTCRPGCEAEVRSDLDRHLGEMKAWSTVLDRLVARVREQPDEFSQAIAWQQGAVRVASPMVDGLGNLVERLIAREVGGPIWLEDVLDRYRRVDSYLAKSGGILRTALKARVAEVERRLGAPEPNGDPFREAFRRIAAALPLRGRQLAAAVHEAARSSLKRCGSDWLKTLPARSVTVGLLDVTLRVTGPSTRSWELLGELLGEATAFASGLPQAFWLDGSVRGRFEGVMVIASEAIRFEYSRRPDRSDAIQSAVLIAGSLFLERIRSMLAARPEDRHRYASTLAVLEAHAPPGSGSR